MILGDQESEKGSVDRAHRFADLAERAEANGNWETAVSKHIRAAECYEKCLGLSDHPEANRTVHLLIGKHRNKALKIRQQVGFNKMLKKAVEKSAKASGQLDERRHQELLGRIQAISGYAGTKLSEIKTMLNNAPLCVSPNGGSQDAAFFKIREPKEDGAVTNSFGMPALRVEDDCFALPPDRDGDSPSAPNERVLKGSPPDSKRRSGQNLQQDLRAALFKFERQLGEKLAALVKTVNELKTSKPSGQESSFGAQDPSAKELRELKQKLQRYEIHNRRQNQKIKELKKANDEFDRAYKKKAADYKTLSSRYQAQRDRNKSLNQHRQRIR